MKKWYKRNFYFNKLNKDMLSDIIIYIICAIVTVFAYNKGIIVVEEYSISYEGIESLISIPLIISSFMYFSFQILMPVGFGISVYWSYHKEFSNRESIKGIIPISNKRKVVNMIVSILIAYIIFLITGYVVNSNIGLNAYMQMEVLSLAILLSLAISFCAIIIDILFREKKFNDIVRLILVGMLSFILFIGLTILLIIIEDKVANIMGISIILLIVFSVLEFSYILKKIDKIKIN